MSDNSKNILQIYCQRNNLSLPIYKQNRNTDGQWVSTVYVSTALGPEVEFIGSSKSRKTHADIAAADIAVSQLGISDINSSNYDIINPTCYTVDQYYASFKCDTNMFVLIDYENINKLLHLHNDYKNINGTSALICKFVGYGHHKSETPEVSHIVNSGRSDAVDHAISMCAGIIMAITQCNVTIIILTGDLFAECLKNICISSEKVKLLHAPSEKQAILELQNRGFDKTNTKIGFKKYPISI